MSDSENELFGADLGDSASISSAVLRSSQILSRQEDSSASISDMLKAQGITPAPGLEFSQLHVLAGVIGNPSFRTFLRLPRVLQLQARNVQRKQYSSSSQAQECFRQLCTSGSSQCAPPFFKFNSPVSAFLHTGYQRSPSVPGKQPSIGNAHHL